jgi:PAS domain-containing protein
MPDRVVDYSERILNVVLDAIDDIILIHDSDHTILWMNKAGLNAWGKTLDQVIGKRCYELHGYHQQCDDCMTPVAVNKMRVMESKKYLPKLGLEYECHSIPVFDDDKNVVLIVQRLHLPCESRVAKA